jgi:hypothetical protein
MTPDSLVPNHIEGADMKKLEALKKAVSEGSYAVSAEDLTPKLLESMFRNIILDETANRPSSSQLEASDQFNPQNNDGLKIPGDAMVHHKDSRLVSVPSDQSPGTEPSAPVS